MLRKGCKYPSSYVKPPSTHPVLMLNPGQGSYASEERQEPGSPLSCHLRRGRGRFSLPEHLPSPWLLQAGEIMRGSRGMGVGLPCKHSHLFLSLNLQTFLSSYPEIRFNVKPNLFFFLKLDVQRPKKNKP